METEEWHGYCICGTWYSNGIPLLCLSLFLNMWGKSRRGYYDAYTLAEQNTQISEILDVTPFLVYFIENVYHKLVTALPAPSITDAFQRALEQGNVTEKEQALWHFVLTAYGSSEFSTKQLEKAFGNAAYATIRGFVLKFENWDCCEQQDMATESNTESKCEKRSDFLEAAKTRRSGPA